MVSGSWGLLWRGSRGATGLEELSGSLILGWRRW